VSDTHLSAKDFMAELAAKRTGPTPTKYGNSLRADETDEFIGVPMGKIFALAKSYTAMPLQEIEMLLESPTHEHRVGAVSIMDFQARKPLTDEQREALFKLYIRRHDRINSWDLVDRSAIRVIGGYLADKPRDILYKLARSKHAYERRTAIVSTLALSMHGDTKDTFAVAELLLHDNDKLVQRAVAWALRTAGRPDLLAFLDKHAATMPRLMLAGAIEKLDPEQRKHYRVIARA
jgi:3-methyladenine DNA glycosylase AlkD